MNDVVSKGVTRQGYQGPRFRDTSIPTVHYSTAAADNLRQMSSLAENVSGKIEDRLDMQAAAEAREVGAREGMDGDPVIREWTTIRGAEYNKAAMSSFAIRNDIQSTQTITKLYGQHSKDPAALQVALADYQKGMTSEISKFSNETANIFQQRFISKSQAYVDKAKENAYLKVKEEAEFAAFEHETISEMEIEAIGTDLFSSNPALSSSAAKTINQIKNEMTQIYNRQAPDPNAYGFMEPVQSAIRMASLENGVPEAYLNTIVSLESKGNPKAKNPKSSASGLFQFIDGTAEQYGITDPFDIEQNAMAGAAFTKDNMEGLREVLGRDPDVGEVYLAHQQGLQGATELLTNPDALAVDVVGKDAVKLNGGREDMTAEEFASKWTNKARKEHSQGTPVFSRMERAEASQAFYDRTMKAAFKGWFRNEENKADAYLDFVSGERKIKITDDQGNVQEVDVMSKMTPKARNEVEDFMREEIKFMNSMDDRREKVERDAIEREKKMSEFDYMLRLNDPNGMAENGQELDPVRAMDVNQAIFDGRLNPNVGRKMLTSLTIERPVESDQALINSLIVRMNNGEDIRTDMLEHMGRINKSDFAQIYTQNNAINVLNNADMDTNQKFYFGLLKQQIFPDMLLQELDTFAPARLANAQIEFRKRIKDGEDPESVYTDIQERANRDVQQQLGLKISGLITPRFSVPSSIDPTLPDVDATMAALVDANKKGELSDDALDRQLQLLEQWERMIPVYQKQKVQSR